jgi:hypothetical protein
MLDADDRFNGLKISGLLNLLYDPGLSGRCMRPDLTPRGQLQSATEKHKGGGHTGVFPFPDFCAPPASAIEIREYR